MKLLNQIAERFFRAVLIGYALLIILTVIKITLQILTK